MEINPSDIESTVAIFTGYTGKGSTERLYALFYRLKDGTCKTRDGNNGADVALQLLATMVQTKEYYEKTLREAEMIVETIDLLGADPAAMPDDPRIAGLRTKALGTADLLRKKIPMMKEDMALMDESEANLKEIVRTGFSTHPVETVSSTSKLVFQTLLNGSKSGPSASDNQAGKPIL